MPPALAQAIGVARGKAWVILDGRLLRIDRVAMASTSRASGHRSAAPRRKARGPAGQFLMADLRR
jgi:hypothetical protein